MINDVSPVDSKISPAVPDYPRILGSVFVGILLFGWFFTVGVPWWMAAPYGFLLSAAWWWRHILSRYWPWIIGPLFFFTLGREFERDPANAVYGLLVMLVGLAVILSIGRIARVKRRQLGRVDNLA